MHHHTCTLTTTNAEEFEKEAIMELGKILVLQPESSSKDAMAELMR